MGVVSRKTERMDELQIKSNEHFLGRHFVNPFFFFTKPVSIKHTIHTNQRYTGTTLYRVGKLFICMKHFRSNPLINESFTGDTHFLVFCNQRIILLSFVIFVDHDWNGSVDVLWMDNIPLPVCPGLR